MMKKQNKSVSIILSCFNGSELIKDYIDFSLKEEIVEHCTLVAVNFPFSHSDPDLVEKELQRYPDINLINYSENVSLYEAWNIGIKAAKTPFVSNLNLDDRVAPSYYAYGVEELIKYSADVFSTASIMTAVIGQHTDEAKPQRHFDDQRFDQNGICEYTLSDMVYLQEGIVKKKNPPHCAPIWRKAIHDSIGYFDSSRFDFAADYEFWLRCASQNMKLITSKEEMTLFFCGNDTASDRLQHLDNQSIIDFWEETFPPHNYRETHLGKNHDRLHYCMNMNIFFSRREYFNHLIENFISVIVVAHKIDDQLIQCIESIRNQSDQLIEVIVVFDGDAKGDYRKNLEKYINNDTRIIIISVGQKRERNYCRNIGLQLATGKWICFVDGDDWLPRDSVAIRRSAAQDSKNIVFGGMNVINDNGEKNYINFGKKYHFEDSKLGWPSHCTLLIPKTSVAQSVRYPANFQDITTDAWNIAGEDVFFMMSLLKSNKELSFINCNKPVYNYRRHNSSSYSKRHASIQKVLDVIFHFHGKPDDSNSPFFQSIQSRAISYFFWHAYDLKKTSSANELSITSNNNYLYEIVKKAERNHLENSLDTLVKEVSFLGSGNIQAAEEAKKLLLQTFPPLPPVKQKQANTSPPLMDTDKKTTSIEKQNQLNEKVAPPIKQRSSHPKNLAYYKKRAIIKLKKKRAKVKELVESTIITPLQEKRNDLKNQRLRRWKDKHRGQKCILLCNGPSLNKVDFSRINLNEYTLFGLNKIHLGFDSLKIQPQYIASVNVKVLEQSADTFNNLNIVKFISNRVDNSLIKQNRYTFSINTKNLPQKHNRFSEDISQYVNEGWTVTHVALQIIYYMGFKEVNIVGMDHRFKQFKEGMENQSSLIEGDDVDHFHPEYFGHGKTWDFPDLVNSEISYKAAREAYERSNRQIYDCTINGACRIFKRKEITEQLYSK